LFSDALDLMPRAGLAGFGLMSFGELACFRGMSPHNDLLQAIVEFGWLGGVAFSAMITLAPILLFRPARSDKDMRFLFLLCAFMIMLGMIYGQISRDLSLFMVLGLAVSVLSEKATSVRKNCDLLQAGELA
jgi:O-antigen ligase